VTVTAMSSSLDSGVVNVTAARAGFSSITLTMTVTKAKGPRPAAGAVSDYKSIFSNVEREDGGTASAGFELETNGTMTSTTLVSGVFTSRGNWYSPTTTGVGSSFWVRFDIKSQAGTAGPTGTTFGVWLPISVSRGFSLFAPFGSVRSCLVGYAISETSSGSDVVASGEVNLRVLSL
jgi:hypothetical protein